MPAQKGVCRPPFRRRSFGRNGIAAPAAAAFAVLTLFWADAAHTQAEQVVPTIGGNTAVRASPPGAMNFLVGGFRVYGQNVSGSTETIIPALQNATSLVFQPIKLRFDFGEGQPFTLLPSQTLGLEAYSAIDFRFTMAEQGAQTFPQPFSSTSASTGLRIVENALQKNLRGEVGDDAKLLLLWTRYMEGARDKTKTIANSAQPAQNIHSRLVIVGDDLIPFTTDKQTVLLEAINAQFIAENYPVGALNITGTSLFTGSIPNFRGRPPRVAMPPGGVQLAGVPGGNLAPAGSRRLLQQAAAPNAMPPAAPGPRPQPGSAQGPMPPSAAAGPLPPGDAVAAAPNVEAGTTVASLGGAVPGAIAVGGRQQQLEVSLWFQVVPAQTQPIGNWLDAILPVASRAASQVGVPLTAYYFNSTVYTGDSRGNTVSIKCDSPPELRPCFPEATLPKEGSKKDSGLSTGAIVGIALGAIHSLLLIVFLVGLVCWCQRRRRRHSVRRSGRAEASAPAGGVAAAAHGPPRKALSTSNSSNSTFTSQGNLSSTDASGVTIQVKSEGAEEWKAQQAPATWPTLAAAAALLPWFRKGSVAARPTDLEMASVKRGSTETELAASSARAGAGYASNGTGVSSVGAGSVAGSTGTVSAEEVEAAAREAAIPAEDVTLCLLPDGSFDVLGKGGFGTVYRAEWKGETVALKRLHAPDRLMLRALRREVAVLRRISAAEGVVNFLGAVLDPAAPAMVLEYCQGGDLRHALANDTQDEFAWHRRGRGVAIDVVRALCFMHNVAGVIHRDIKSSNVLLTAEGRAKLGDVGLAKILSEDHFSSVAAIGTFAYIAPELLLGHHCSNKVDIYSFGVLCYEICTKTPPVRGQLNIDTTAPGSTVPPAVAAIFWRCMATDPSQRPTAPQLLNMLLDT